MTRDSGRHAQRGDVQQAPPEGCQSVIAQRIPTSPPIGTDEELIERLRSLAMFMDPMWKSKDAKLIDNAADALVSRISEVERLTALLSEITETIEQAFPALALQPLFVKARAALSQHRATG